MPIPVLKKTIAMLANLEIDSNRRTPIYMQIANSITKAIKQGKYKKGDRIFSINEVSNEFLLSRDTVQKAYDLLEKERIIEAVRGKGFYINRTDIAIPYRILLVFNKLSSYKKIIYDSFIKTLGNKATVDLKICHSDIRVLESIIDTSQGEYDYYVIMPHFYDKTATTFRILEKIPHEKLILLDKDLCGQQQYTAVFQDFENDIMEALVSGLTILKKYKRLNYIHPPALNHLDEIMYGFRKFCIQYNFEYSILDEIKPGAKIESNEVYIVIKETDLVNLIKSCQSSGQQVGKDVGIISYNDSPLKEILLDGITVLSTDHGKMGETAARLILDNRKGKIKNPFSLILRNSL